MKQIFNLTLLSLIAVFLTACASTTTKLDRSALEQNKISKIHFVLNGNLDVEKSTSGTNSGAIVGGLIGVAIGASIDASTNKKRKIAFTPLLNALGDYNIEKVFSQKLKGLSGRAFEPELEVSHATLDINNKETNQGLNTLNITGGFLLSAKHKDSIASVKILLKTSEKGKPFAKILTEKTSGDFNEKEKKVVVSQFWLDNPDKLKSLIELSMDKLIEKIAFEINTGTSKEE